jgi:hypothetical protein
MVVAVSMVVDVVVSSMGIMVATTVGSIMNADRTRADARLSDLDRRSGKSNLSTNLYSTSILFELAMAIDEHRLVWTDLVREKFQTHLHSIPVLQRHKIFGYIMEAPTTA